MSKKQNRPDLIDALEPYVKMSWIEKIVGRAIYSKAIKKIENMKSPVTTLLGVFTLLGAVGSVGIALLDGNPATQPDFNAIMLALAGLGLIKARDNNVSSEKAGAK